MRRTLRSPKSARAPFPTPPHQSPCEQQTYIEAVGAPGAMTKFRPETVTL
jgi:hypothetical protein